MGVGQVDVLRIVTVPTKMAARTVVLLARGTAAISTGIPFETPFFWDSLEEFCDAPVCPTW
jgi:hypothetical protein